VFTLGYYCAGPRYRERLTSWFVSKNYDWLTAARYCYWKYRGSLVTVRGATHQKTLGHYIRRLEGQLWELDRDEDHGKPAGITRKWKLTSRFERSINITRNTFRGTWYLPHSQVHNERTVPIIMSGCIAHARNGHISTSALKSDATVVFLDPISFTTRKFRQFGHKLE